MAHSLKQMTMCTKQSITELLQLLSDLEDQNDQQARRCLQAANTYEVVSLLHTALAASPNIEQCCQIISLLSQLQDTRSIPVLSQLLSARHPLVSQNAERALIQFEIPEAYDALVAAIPHATNFIVPHIVKSLGKSGYKPAIPALMELVKTTDSHMLRYLAIEALGCLGAIQATDLIQSHLDHDNHHVRTYAAKALEQLTAIYQGEEPSCS